MNIVELDEQNKAQYETFVKENHGSVLQSWHWGEWMKQNREQVYRFALNEDSRWILTAQVTKKQILNDLYYLYIPYGPTSKKNTSSEQLDLLLSYLEKKFPGNVYVYFEPLKNIDLHYSKVTARIQPGSTLFMDLTKSMDEILNGMHHKTRYNIRLASKNNLIIRENNSSDLSLIQSTSERVNYKSHSVEYYKKLYDFFKDNTELHASILSIYAHNHPIAAGLFLDYHNTRVYLAGGSDYPQRKLMAPYLLHYEAMQRAKDKGLHQYDFWGMETSSGLKPGFVRFKEGFGGTLFIYPSAFRIVNKKGAYFLLSLYRKLRKLL